MTDNAMLNEVLKLQSLMKSRGLETAKPNRLQLSIVRNLVTTVKQNKFSLYSSYFYNIFFRLQIMIFYISSGDK